MAGPSLGPFRRRSVIDVLQTMKGWGLRALQARCSEMQGDGDPLRLTARSSRRPVFQTTLQTIQRNMATLAASGAALPACRQTAGGACARPRARAPQLQRPSRCRAPAAVAGAGAFPGGGGEFAGAPPPSPAAPIAEDHLLEDHQAAESTAPSSNSKPSSNGKPHLPSSIYVAFPKDALPPDGHTLTLKVRRAPAGCASLLSSTWQLQAHSAGRIKSASRLLVQL